MLLDILLNKYRSLLCLHEINISLLSHPFDVSLTKNVCDGKLE
jgi:hypothetical protein